MKAASSLLSPRLAKEVYSVLTDGHNKRTSPDKCVLGVILESGSGMTRSVVCMQKGEGGGEASRAATITDLGGVEWWRGWQRRRCLRRRL